MVSFIQLNAFLLKNHKNQKMEVENNVLTMQTIQIAPIRNLYSALKDLVPDVTMIIDKNGMKIINFDKNHTTLVAVKMKFEKHECTPDKIVICANSLHLFKLISNTSNDDLFSMYIDKEDYHDGSESIWVYNTTTVRLINAIIIN